MAVGCSKFTSYPFSNSSRRFLIVSAKNMDGLIWIPSNHLPILEPFSRPEGQRIPMAWLWQWGLEVMRPTTQTPYSGTEEGVPPQEKLLRYYQRKWAGDLEWAELIYVQHNNNKQQSYLVGYCCLDCTLILIPHAGLNCLWRGTRWPRQNKMEVLQGVGSSLTSSSQNQPCLLISTPLLGREQS